MVTIKMKITFDIDNKAETAHTLAAVEALHRKIAEWDASDSAKKMPITHHAHINGALPQASDDAFLSTPVRELPIKPRVIRALIAAGFDTIGHLMPLTTNQIREVRDIGRAGRSSLAQALADLDLRPDWHP